MGVTAGGCVPLLKLCSAMVGTCTAPRHGGELEGPGAACPAAGTWEQDRVPPALYGHHPCPQAACRTLHRQGPAGVGKGTLLGSPTLIWVALPPPKGSATVR